MVHDLGDPPRPVLAALAAAERVLSRRAGAGIVLADPEDLGGSDRSVVARARVARNPFSLLNSSPSNVRAWSSSAMASAARTPTGRRPNAASVRAPSRTTTSVPRLSINA